MSQRALSNPWQKAASKLGHLCNLRKQPEAGLELTILFSHHTIYISAGDCIRSESDVDRPLSKYHDTIGKRRGEKLREDLQEKIKEVEISKRSG